MRRPSLSTYCNEHSTTWPESRSNRAARPLLRSLHHGSGCQSDGVADAQYAVVLNASTPERPGPDSGCCSASTVTWHPPVVFSTNANWVRSSAIFGGRFAHLELIIVYAFDSAICRIYNVNLKLLPTVYHYTGQTDVRNNIVRRRHQFLSKCSLNSNSVIRYIAHRFDSQSTAV